jgi:proteasome lid subunit RPN8/RPN11
MLELPAAVRDEILAHARDGAPEEVVGVLAGRRGDDRSTAERIYKAENAAETPETRYEIAPAEELNLLERAEDAGFDVVGFYHSHPRGPAGPSRTDARLAAWPGYSYVIVSLAGDEAEIGSWRWTGEAFEGEVIEVALPDG